MDSLFNSYYYSNITSIKNKENSFLNQIKFTNENID